MIKLHIGNGDLDFEAGKSVNEVVDFFRKNPGEAKRLGVASQMNDVIVAEIDGKFSDLSTVLNKGANVVFFGVSSIEGLDALRHSAAHILAQAVLHLFPGTKLGIGPTIKDGFYYDMDVAGVISEEDLPRIEAEMQKIVEADYPLVREEISREEAIKRYRKMDDQYKVELLEEMSADTVSLYHQDDFTDLCRGPHIPSTKYLKAFKLLSVAGAYWRGSEKNKMLTRVYGTAFADKKQLKEYLEMLEEARKRDHRKLGKELGLYTFHEEAPGMPFWHPRGLLLKRMLIDFMREKLKVRNYIEIETPYILKDFLWTRSGHIETYKENMFFIETQEGENMAVKPMNCPGGMIMYKEEKHSYRELPMKVAEFGQVHRYERSGQLHGLIRVRGFVQDDAHVFMTRDMIEEQVLEAIHLIDETYKEFGYRYHLELSTRPEHSIGTAEAWEFATAGLQRALDKFGKDYKINEGDGAFYGPKIDFHLQDAIGRTHQCGTIQLDMNLPERFDLTYTGQDGQEHRVVMIHRAVYGSLDRFIGILVEHYGGKFPAWLSPVQVSILPVSDKFNDYAEKVLCELEEKKVRVETDLSSEKLGYKIRKATLEKVPYMLIVGEKEVESSSVSVRSRDRGELGSMTTADFSKHILEEIKKKS